MKQGMLGIWLRVVVAAGAAIVAGACVSLLPAAGRYAAEMNPEYAHFYWPCLIVIWLSALAVLYACLLVWRMAGDLRAGRVFRSENARRLKRIAQLALGDVAAYALGAVMLFALNALHPGVLLGVMAVQFAGVAIAVACAALSHVVKRGAAMQLEQALTV